MNNSSPRILRSGNIIASTSSDVTIESTNTQNSNMEKKTINRQMNKSNPDETHRLINQTSNKLMRKGLTTSKARWLH